jgi:acyl carrier protein
MPKPETADVRRFVCELIADFVEITVEMTKVEADVFETYGVESLQLVELMTAIENRFDVHLEFDDFRAARTIIEISDLVSRRIQEGMPSGDR